MMKKFLLVCAFVMIATGVSAQKKVMFDLSHGQFQDKFVDPSYYDYVIPEYEKIAREGDYRLVMNKSEITELTLEGIDALLIISPLAKSTQKNLTETEKRAIVNYIERGGSVIMFIDEEQYRVNLEEYGVNDITLPFGIEVLDDFEVPGNCGAVTFENEIFGGRREIPCSGVRGVKGGTPASVCMEQGRQISSFVHLDNGGKLYVAGETMVALLMGDSDGERNVHKMMETRW
ncbi:MAG TPA: hypothetical protein P5167_01600 [Bacteroidales bacterium]|nr:hypothetical protein [Bacteroidales bacterium]HRW94518.1 hypothetical protein [Bacteroidales bacterium]